MKKAIKITLIVLLCLLIIVSALAIIFINKLMGVSKNMKFDKDRLLLVNTEIMYYDNNDQLYTKQLTNQSTVSISDIPEYVTEAFVSIEDKNFFNHKGLNYKRIAKATFNNIKNRHFVEGASTISQQLIKNTYLTPEKTIKRKIKEMLLTKKLEQNFSKQEILEMYLNIIYFGEGIYGIKDASKLYFNKEPNELTLTEGATLAGIIKSPGVYSPINHPDKCVQRRNLVLKEMLKDSKITQSVYDESILEDLNLDVQVINTKKDPYFDSAINEATKILNMSKKDIALSGYKIYTYLDNDKQKILQDIVSSDKYYETNKYNNTADSLAIIIDNKTNGVSAFCGKSDYNLTDLKRQPGSAIKPILVYAPLIEDGDIYPCTQILDEPININGYSPKNVGGYHDYVSIRDAISLSLNVPAVKLLDQYGIDKAKAFASRFGIHFAENDNGLAIALGGFTDGITLEELTNAFTTFADGGLYKNSGFVRKITDKNGKVLYNHDGLKTQIISNDTAYLMTDLLISGVKEGTSKRLAGLDYQVAGKTGTVVIPNTNNNSDAISVAYTSDLAMGVWMGNYTNQSSYYLPNTTNGGTFPTSIIRDTLSKIYAENKPKDFDKPSSIVELKIDKDEYDNNHNILIAQDNMPERFTYKQLFSSAHLPTEISNSYNNLNATEFDVKIDGINAKISLNAKKYFTYRIYRVDNKNEVLAFNIEDNDGQIELKETLKPDTTYKYYVETSNATDTVRSDYITILTSNNYEKLLNNLDYSSWYFAS